ncbi:MAG: hypothetical protein U0840_29060 [Gemmataceae bacterium]
MDPNTPNSTKCGGLTEAWAHRLDGVRSQHPVGTHGWNAAVELPADLHLSAVMPVARQVEYLACLLMAGSQQGLADCHGVDPGPQPGSRAVGCLAPLGPPGQETAAVNVGTVPGRWPTTAHSTEVAE